MTGKEIDKGIYASIGGRALDEILTLDRSLTPDLSDLLQKMVDRDYTKRPTLDEVLCYLQNLDDNGNKISTGPTPPGDRKYAKRNRNGTYTLFKGDVRQGVVKESDYKKYYETEYPLEGSRPKTDDKSTGTEPTIPKHSESRKYATRNRNGTYSIYTGDTRQGVVQESDYKKNYETDYPIRE